jgi:LEA14-like dessication related protein
MKKTMTIALLLLLGLSSCALLKTLSHLKTPTFRYQTYHVKDVTVTKTDVDFVFACYNPNDLNLSNVSMDYDLFVEGKKLVAGKGIKVDLKAKDTTRITVPAEVVYKDVIRIAGATAEKIVLDKKSIPVRIDAVLHYDNVIHFSLKVSQTVDVPLQPVEEQIKNGVKNAIHKLL